MYRNREMVGRVPMAAAPRASHCFTQEEVPMDMYVDAQTIF